MPAPSRPDARWWPWLWDAGVLALAVLGPDRRYRMVNDALCRWLETDSGTLISWSYERIGHPLDLDVELDAFVRLAEGAAAVSYPRRYRTAAGNELTATVHAIAGLDDDVLQLIIPQQAVVTNTLKPHQVPSVLEQIASALSHDAQEPARQLGVSAGLLAERLGPLLQKHERERELLRGMEHHTARLNRQLRGLVRFARLGPPVIDPAPYPLKSLVDSALTQVTCTPSVTLQENLPSDVGLRCDRTQVIAALVELLRNACAARPPGHPIHVMIAAEQTAEHVMITVHDDGAGIASADQARLFRLFSNRGSDAGPGIGLALVRAVAVGHGGKVHLESTPGAGTTARLVLPR